MYLHLSVPYSEMSIGRWYSSVHQPSFDSPRSRSAAERIARTPFLGGFVVLLRDVATWRLTAATPMGRGPACVSPNGVLEGSAEYRSHGSGLLSGTTPPGYTLLGSRLGGPAAVRGLFGVLLRNLQQPFETHGQDVVAGAAEPRRLLTMTPLVPNSPWLFASPWGIKPDESQRGQPRVGRPLDINVRHRRAHSRVHGFGDVPG